MNCNEKLLMDFSDCEQNQNDVHVLQLLDEIFERFAAQETTNLSDIGKESLLISVGSLKLLTYIHSNVLPY